MLLPAKARHANARATDNGTVLDHHARTDAFSATLSIVAGPTRAYPGEPIHRLIELQVEGAPHATALVCGNDRLDYAELDRRANRLARHLRTRLGNDGGRIGIAVSRSSDMVVAFLATLKAGFAYVPLDPTHPAVRARAMLEEARAIALVVDGESARALAPSGTCVIDVVADEDEIARQSATSLGIVVDADAPAYVIFTSGTTGAPKGVEVAHRSLVNMVATMAHEPGFTAADVLVAVTTIAFDMSVFEIYATLAAGGTLVVATNEDVVDGHRLRRLIEDTGATMLQSTPATWRLLAEADFHAKKGFRMLSGGERLARALADRLLDGEGDLWNVYGPTETTVYATCARVYRGEPVTIGRPLANTFAYVLDDLGRPVERGVLGELYIGGDALARGYIHAPELTARRFPENPFHGGRMYRTGDSARMLPDGTIDIFGRLDDQVKLRGYRIELGEIETALMDVCDLSATAVVLREDSGRAGLVAYLVARTPDTLDTIALADRLYERLPPYMVPSAWVVLDALPLSANGKVDRRALPAPAIASSRAPVVPLETPLEKRLGAVWSDVLGSIEIGRHDDIFALGADSIQIFAIVARANGQGIGLFAHDIMRKRTIAKIAGGLEVPQSSAGRRLTRSPVTRTGDVRSADRGAAR